VLTRHAAVELFADVSLELARAPADIEAVLTLATSRLSRIRPATWVAMVMYPDTETSRIVVADDRDRELARYIEDYVATIDRPQRTPTVGLSRRVIESGCPIVIPKMSLDELLLVLSPAEQAYLYSNPPPGEVRTIGLVIVPMRVGSATLGTLAMLDARDRHIVEQGDVEWIQMVGDRVGLSVEHARLAEGTLVHAAEMDIVRTIILAQGQGSNARVTLGAVVDRIITLPDIDAADVMLLTDDGKELIVAASAGYRWPFPPEHRVDARWLELEQHPRRTEVGRRADLDLAGHHLRRSQFAREAFQTFIGLPLHGPTRTIGVLDVYSRSLMQWERNRLEFLETLGGLVAMAIEHAAGAPQGSKTRRSAAPAFTDLEVQILRLLAEGFTNREIATRVYRSQNTVKSHLGRMLEMADAGSRTELVARAVGQGWI
jgi:DNA-binding CsgD family transcriptional regulator